MSIFTVIFFYVSFIFARAYLYMKYYVCSVDSKVFKSSKVFSYLIFTLFHSTFGFVIVASLDFLLDWSKWAKEKKSIFSFVTFLEILKPNKLYNDDHSNRTFSVMLRINYKFSSFLHLHLIIKESQQNKKKYVCIYFFVNKLSKYKYVLIWFWARKLQMCKGSTFRFA